MGETKSCEAEWGIPGGRGSGRAARDWGSQVAGIWAGGAGGVKTHRPLQAARPPPSSTPSAPLPSPAAPAPPHPERVCAPPLPLLVPPPPPESEQLSPPAPPSPRPYAPAAPSTSPAAPQTSPRVIRTFKNRNFFLTGNIWSSFLTGNIWWAPKLGGVALSTALQLNACEGPLPGALPEMVLIKTGPGRVQAAKMSNFEVDVGTTWSGS